MTIDWAGERILVTGGTGMIGANLVRRLVGLGSRPTILARDAGHRARLADLDDHLSWFYGDITDADAVAEAVHAARPHAVFHLASTFFNPPTLPAVTHMATNATGTLHLCEALKSLDGVRLVLAGSCAVYAGGSALREDAPVDPGSVFGVSKAVAGVIARGYARLYGIETVELRLFTPFGPWENARRLIPDTILSALAGREMRIGHGRQQRDFVYMDDVVDAFLRAAAVVLPERATPINIGSGIGRSVRDVAARVLEFMGNPVALKSDHQPPRPDEIWEISAGIATAEQVLGWRPQVSFDDGLRRTIDWFREHRVLAAVLK